MQFTKPIYAFTGDAMSVISHQTLKVASCALLGPEGTYSLEGEFKPCLHPTARVYVYVLSDGTHRHIKAASKAIAHTKLYDRLINEGWNPKRTKAHIAQNSLANRTRRVYV